MFIESVSENKWYHGKTPKLQINILRQIITSGEISKKKAAEMLGANYPDVSDAMDALSRLEFIKIPSSGKRLTTGHNYEKFYKITEKGLQALLEIELDNNEFWKVIILLCMCSSRPLDKNKLEQYFSKYEYGILGHRNIQGFFFLICLFDSIIYNLFKVSNEYKRVLPFQRVLECLALNGPSKINDLVNKTHMTKIEINNVINSNDSYPLKRPKSKTTKNSKLNYLNRILQILIVQDETNEGFIYELSLLGVIVVLATITYHFAGVDNLRFEGGNRKGPRLFYTNINLIQYFDTIAFNYKNKIPLIFGKWDLLRSQLGVMLYNSFDFLLYKINRIRTINETVWSGGFKEYHDDLQTLSLKAIRKLYPIYLSGNEVVKEFERQQVWLANDSRMEPVYNKLREIDELLICTRIQEQFKFEYPMLRENVLPNCDEIKRIENLFRNEITFLFYLSLNTKFIITKSYKYSFSETKSLVDGLFEIPDEIRVMRKLGSPKDCLMAILSKDKDIKDWFSAWITDIIEYRQKTSDQILEFYDQISNSSRKRKLDRSPAEGMKIYLRPEGVKVNVSHQEYNIEKICINDF